jgi:hypothetical protein
MGQQRARGSVRGGSGGGRRAWGDVRGEPLRFTGRVSLLKSDCCADAGASEEAGGKAVEGGRSWEETGAAASAPLAADAAAVAPLAFVVLLRMGRPPLSAFSASSLP